MLSSSLPYLITLAASTTAPGLADPVALPVSKLS